ncbi:hypothetical protein ES703_97045 [subsurface metagenome]
MDIDPGTEEAPFATIDRARAAVRELKKPKTGPVTVYVRRGTYYLDRPLVFEPGESNGPVKIGEVLKKLIKNLSKGYGQRIGLAQALVGDPQMLILDEPTIGPDPKQIIEIRKLIKDLGQDHTIILNSHILPEVTAVCQRVIIIHKGKIVAGDTINNLSADLRGSHKLTIRAAGLAILMIRPIDYTLEDIFIQLTTDEEEAS